MLSPVQWVRRRIELAQHAPRRREIEAELARLCGEPVRLVSSGSKRGYDEIYFAQRSGQRFAVVRVNSGSKRQPKPAGPRDPVMPLGPRERLNHEWHVYERLSPLGLSPQPIWRADDAIACGWMTWPRVSEIVLRDRAEFWPSFSAIVPAVSQMHRLGLTHLDLNLGNILTDPATRRVAFIDFEFAPAVWLTIPQQRAFDYLRLIDECLRPRRGGRQLLSDVGRIVSLLQTHVDPEARAADVQFVSEKLHRLTQQVGFCQQLRAVFPTL